MTWWALKRDRPRCDLLLRAPTRRPAPGFAAATGAPLVARSSRRINEATDEDVRADLATLPGQLDKVDAWIADGVLGGEQPNAADFQIGASVALLR